MSEHHEQNPSGFEAPPPGGAEGGGGSGAEAGGGAEGGADRFWQRYGTTRPHGRPGARNGGGEGDAQPQRNGAGEHECLEWCPICRGAEVMRATTPPELREQWQTVQRDALVMVRGLIDAYLERIGEGPRSRPPQRVEDIPIE